MVKKIILIFLGIVIVAVGGLFAYISMVDWNTHRQDIADKISEITGKKIEFSGPISVELLPQPTLSAKNVKIINPNRNAEVLATIDSLNTVVSLQSLLKGTPDIRSLSLVGAEVWVNINENGELNWQNYNKSSFSNSDRNTKLQSLNIQNALVHFENAAEKMQFDLSQFNADIQAETLAGPYRLDGNFMKNQDHFGVALNLGSFSGLNDVTVNFAITHPKSESYLRFDGTYMPNEQAYKGDFSGNSKQTADFANILTDMKILDEIYNVPLQFSVGIETDSEQIKLSSFIIKYGNFMEGAGSMLIPLRAEQGQNRNVDLKYQLVNLDLRPLLSIFKAEYKNFVEKGSVYKPDFNININADISSERVVLNDEQSGALESVSLKGAWKDNTLSLDEFYAACAGNTVLTMEGSLVEENQSPQYFLKVSADSKDFLAFLNGLGFKLQSYTQATYRNANVAFSLSGNNNAVSANDIKFSMDKMNITGVAGGTFKDDGNIYEIQLAADTLNLDNYLPNDKKSQDFMSMLKSDIQNLSFLKWITLHANLQAENLIFRNAAMTEASLQIETEEESGKLHVVEASAENMYNTDFKLSADVENLGSLDISFANLKFDVQSKNFENIKNKLKLPLPDWKIFASGNFNAAGEYNGNLHEGNFQIKGAVGDVKVEYNGEIKQDENFGFSGDIDIKTTNFSEFVNNIGGTLKSENSLRGALNCKSKVAGTSAEWNFDETNCLLGIANYQGSGQVQTNKNSYKIKAMVKTDDLNLENITDVQYAMNAPAINRQQENSFFARPEVNADTFVFDIYRNLDLDIDLTADKVGYRGKTFNQLHTNILNSENIMQLKNLTAVFNDLNFSGDIQINYVQTPTVKGNMKIGNIVLNGAGGNVYGFNSGVLNLEGSFEMPAASVSDFVNNYTGSLRFSGTDVAVKGLDIAKIEEDLSGREYSKGLFQQIRDSLQSGETAFSEFSGEIKADSGNLLYNNFVLKADGADIAVDGTLNVSEWKMNNTFTVNLIALPDIPQFSFSLSGLVNKPALDINIEEVARKYDAHWEQIEAEEKERKAEEIRQLNQKMSEAQEKVKQVSEIANSFVPQLEEYQKNSRDETYVAWYEERLAEISQINQTLDGMKAQEHLPDFTEADVQEINDYCRQTGSRLDNLPAEIQEHYKNDVLGKFGKITTSLAENNQKYEELNVQYQQLLKDKFEELSKIEAAAVMSQNQKLKGYQTEFSGLNEELRKKYEETARQIQETENLQNDIPQLEQKTADLYKQLDEYSNSVQKAEDVFAKTQTLLNEISAEQQKIYAEKIAKKKEEEKKKKAEEGNLEYGGETETVETEDDANAASDNSLPVINVKNNHIDDDAPQMVIKVEPGQVNKPTLRKITAENAEAKVTVSGTIKKSYEEKSAEAPKTGGLLKEVEGAVQKPTGRIIVK